MIIGSFSSPLAWSKGGAEKCPAPKDCRKFERSRDACVLNPEHCDTFVDIYEKMAGVHGCAMKEDRPKEQGGPILHPVPALWLCTQLHANLLYTALSGIKSIKGRKFYASETFRRSVVGPAGGHHQQYSRQLEQELKRQGILP